MDQGITSSSQTHKPPLKNPSQHITAPGSATQSDLVPELIPSGGYEKIMTAMDVFSRYLFAYPTSNQDAKTIATVIISNITKRTCFLPIFIPDKTSTFVSHTTKEVADVHGIILKHASTGHAQTIGMLERSQVST